MVSVSHRAIATMVRGLMANILSPAELNAIFRETAERQHESPLLFSTVVDLLGLVVSKAQRSLHAERTAKGLATLGERTTTDSPSMTASAGTNLSKRGSLSQE